MKFKKKRSKDKRHYFTLQGKNNEIILTGLMKDTENECDAAIAAAKMNAKHYDRFDIGKSTDKKDYFTLRNRNGDAIGQSEMYNQMQGLKKGIFAVQKACGWGEAKKDKDGDFVKTKELDTEEDKGSGKVDLTPKKTPAPPVAHTAESLDGLKRKDLDALATSSGLNPQDYKNIKEVKKALIK